VVLWAGASAAAAEAQPLARGTEVRVVVEDGPMRRVAGRLLASDPGSITVETARGTERMSRDSVYHVQYKAGGRNRQKGAAIGAAITGVAGLVAGIVLAAKESDEGHGCDQCGIGVGLLAAVSAVPGAAIGYAIGAPGSNWRDATGRGLNVVGAGPARGGTLVRVRLP
jgi:hypothetical protein